MFRFGLIVVAGILATRLAMAAASPPDTLPQFLNWLNSPNHQRAQSAALVRLEPSALASQCPQLVPRSLIGWLAVEPIVWSRSSHQPTAGSWLEKFSVERCDQIVTRRILATVDRHGKVHYTAMIPGETLANYTLEMRARGAIIRHAEIKDKCRDPRRLVWLDSAIVTPPDPNKSPDQWSEVWSGIACGVDFKTTLRFAPNPQNRTDPKEITATIIE
ncbi:MAG: hypothetical protein QM523_01825 [Candidatus Pacebacteria bacterium]|nr:hypothetical protein [Candidatus Paceibacterota bacterium]